MFEDDAFNLKLKLDIQFYLTYIRKGEKKLPIISRLHDSSLVLQMLANEQQFDTVGDIMNILLILLCYLRE